MSAEKRDLWALLAEALKKLEAADLWHPPGTCRCMGCSIARPIDAALAAREAEAQSEVAWHLDYGMVYAKSGNGCQVNIATVRSDRTKTYKWFAWQPEGPSSKQYEGFAYTLDDAKAAAIRAARGMR